MKALVFHIGADRYGLPLAAVARVLPAAALKQLPLAPAWVAGVLDLHGAPVPVIDLAQLAGRAPAPLRYDTRIVLVDYPLPGGGHHALGLLAERVAGVAKVDEHTLAETGVRGAPFLGRVASSADGMLQLVELAQLLGAEVRALLFQPRSVPA